MQSNLQQYLIKVGIEMCTGNLLHAVLFLCQKGSDIPVVVLRVFLFFSELGVPLLTFKLISQSQLSLWVVNL